MTFDAEAFTRFFALVDVNGPTVRDLSPCWLWKGGRMSSGYGFFRWRGHGALAHRAAWELFFEAEIPKGLFILHRCDVKLCVRPTHLSPGSAKENSCDMVAKGRNKVLSLPGDANPAAKLGWGDVDEIRRRYAAGGTTQRQLAAAFGVHQTVIGNIVRGETWVPTGKEGVSQ